MLQRRNAAKHRRTITQRFGNCDDEEDTFSESVSDKGASFGSSGDINESTSELVSSYSPGWKLECVLSNE